jgi:hypothetical protein
MLHDTMTRVNMDFVQDVCYAGMFTLDASVASGTPTGLSVFGNWPTVYAALAQLPPPVQKSWFAFDHYYSDSSFSDALPYVCDRDHLRLLDIGGSTGKWATLCCAYNATIHIGICDLPGQLAIAQQCITEAGYHDRVTYHETNVLDDHTTIPQGYDIIWMSQFLDCFSEAEIVSILQRCRHALGDKGRIIILEPFWDLQDNETAAFCLQMTSLYFTNIANGNSRMYQSTHFHALIRAAGLEVMQQIDELGISNTLMICSRK